MSGNLTLSAPHDVAHLVDERGRVRCAFLRQHGNDRSIDHASIHPGTGLGAWRMRLRSAASTHALQLDYRMWAMPGLVGAAPGDWLVYEADPDPVRAPIFLKRLPSSEAAEMWMLHYAPQV